MKHVNVCGLVASVLRLHDRLFPGCDVPLQKAGIFKTGVPALSVLQEDEGMRALEGTAAEVGAPFSVSLEPTCCAETTAVLEIVVAVVVARIVVKAFAVHVVLDRPTGNSSHACVPDGGW